MSPWSIEIIFPDICWFIWWFPIYSLFLGINYFTSYIRVISNRLSIYFFDSYATSSNSSFFHHSFSVTDMNRSSTFILSLNFKFSIFEYQSPIWVEIRLIYFRFFYFQNHFYSQNLYSPISSGKIWIWTFTKFLWEYHENQVYSRPYFFTFSIISNFCLHKKIRIHTLKMIVSDPYQEVSLR